MSKLTIKGNDSNRGVKEISIDGIIIPLKRLVNFKVDCNGSGAKLTIEYDIDSVDIENLDIDLPIEVNEKG